MNIRLLRLFQRFTDIVPRYMIKPGQKYQIQAVAGPISNGKDPYRTDGDDTPYNVHEPTIRSSSPAYFGRKEIVRVLPAEDKTTIAFVTDEGDIFTTNENGNI